MANHLSLLSTVLISIFLTSPDLLIESPLNPDRLVVIVIEKPRKVSKEATNPQPRASILGVMIGYHPGLYSVKIYVIGIMLRPIAL